MKQRITMARAQISIKLDEELLARVDQLAEDASVTRTAVIEQAIANDLPEQEAFYRSLENPVIRAIHKKITTPGMLRVLAAIVNDDLTDEEIERITERAPKQREAAVRRKSQKKASRKPRLGGA